MGVGTGIGWNHETSHGISSTFSFLRLVCFGCSIFCRVIPIPSLLFPLGAFSLFFASAFLGLALTLEEQV